MRWDGSTAKAGRPGAHLGPGRGDGRQRAVHRRQPHAQPRPARAAHRGRARPLHATTSRRSSACARSTSPTPGARGAADASRRCARGSALPPPASWAATCRAPTRCRLRRVPGAPHRPDRVLPGQADAAASRRARLRRHGLGRRRSCAACLTDGQMCPELRGPGRPAAAGRAPHDGRHEPRAAARHRARGRRRRRPRGLRHQRAGPVRRPRSRRSASDTCAAAVADPLLAARATTCAAARELSRRAARAAASTCCTRTTRRPGSWAGSLGPARGRPGRGQHLPRALGRAARTGWRQAARGAAAPRPWPRGLARRALPERRGPADAAPAGAGSGGPGWSATASTSTGSGRDPRAAARVRPRAGRRRRRAARRRCGSAGRREGHRRVRRRGAGARGTATFVWVGPDDTGQARRPRPTADATASRFLGERTDMPAVYSALDVFVLPSYREGFSRSGMEAAACGLADGAHRHPRLPRDRQRRAASSCSSRRGTPAPWRGTSTGCSSTTRPCALGSARPPGAGARASFDQRAVAAASLQTYAAVARRKGSAGRWRRCA